MLVHLGIENLAIVERAELAFGPGLTVLTGETGAGKSILVDALELAVGGRGSPDFLRAGAERASVDAVFRLSDRPDLLERLARMGVEASEGELVVRRVISRDGKSRIWLSGAPASVGMLAELGAELVDFYGQHEHQSLRSRDVHRALLDAFAGAEPELERVGRLHAEAAALAAELGALRRAEGGREERCDFLRFQIREIEEARPEPGEDAALAEERRRLANAERLAQAARAAHELLYEGERSASDLLGEASAALAHVSQHDPELEAQRARLASAAAEIEDAARELGRYAEGLEADPERLAEVEARLDLLQRLRRKHGGSAEEILAKLAAMRRELASLEGGESRAAELEAALSALREKLREAADRLSAKRAAAAKRLARSVEAELARLKMDKSRFRAQITPRGEIGPLGADAVEFLMAPNAGEEPKPLVKIASGGELSRAMLAIKRSLLGVGAPPTLVFDEVDAGIGGETAAAVGDLLAETAAGSQLLVITHLPQIAARGAAHFRVEKAEEGGRTVSRARRLEGKDREREIARMLGGERYGDAALRAAREMLAAGARGREGEAR